MKSVSRFFVSIVLLAFATSGVWATSGAETKAAGEAEREHGGESVQEEWTLEDGSVVTIATEVRESGDPAVGAEVKARAFGDTALPAIVGDDADLDRFFTTAIQKAYRRLSAYVRSGGREIRFKVSDFEHLAADKFDTIYYADIATLPSGSMLNMARGSHTDRINKRVNVEYVPSWTDSDIDWKAQPEGSQMLTMKLRDVLEEVSKRHLAGTNHATFADFPLTCTCNSQCTSICSAQVSTLYCEERGGNLDACHKMASANRRRSPGATPWCWSSPTACW